MRPIGGIFFGHIGDKYGRKKAIVASVFLMALTSTCIGLLPTHHNTHIHSVYWVITPLLLLRLLQGFAVSGEYAGMFTFVGEMVSKKHYFFCQSFVGFGSGCGLLLGTLIGNLVLSLHHGNMTGNAWRIPFLLSFVLGFVGLYLRLKAVESPVFIAMQKDKKTVRLPIKIVMLKHYKTIIFGYDLFLMPYV
ncbi:MAG: MHS family MFS transporter [Gammaproteobacteria bacterium]|nr:MHS family MFS transporter [Gammaproteobacteria bacterium]